MSLFGKIISGVPFLMRTTQILRFKCCDCGLVHDIAIVPKRGGWIEIAMVRDNRRTENVRRSHEVRSTIQSLLR